LDVIVALIGVIVPVFTSKSAGKLVKELKVRFVGLLKQSLTSKLSTINLLSLNSYENGLLETPEMEFLNGIFSRRFLV
jgi:hypothetical protein